MKRHTASGRDPQLWWQSMRTPISQTIAFRTIRLSNYRDLLHNQWNPWARVCLPQPGDSLRTSSPQHLQIIKLLMLFCLAKTTSLLISVREARNYKNSKQQDKKLKLKTKMFQSCWACQCRDHRPTKCQKTSRINVTQMGKCLLMREGFLQTPHYLDVLTKARIKYCRLISRKLKLTELLLEARTR